MATPYAGNEKAWWVVFTDHCGKKKFFSSHDTETEATDMAREKNQENTANAERLRSEAEALESKIGSVADDKHRAKIKKQDAGHLLKESYSVRKRPGFVHAKAHPEKGLGEEMEYHIVPEEDLPKSEAAKHFALSNKKFDKVTEGFVRIPVMIPDPNWAN